MNTDFKQLLNLIQLEFNLRTREDAERLVAKLTNRSLATVQFWLYKSHVPADTLELLKLKLKRVK